MQKFHLSSVVSSIGRQGVAWSSLKKVMRVAGVKEHDHDTLGVREQQVLELAQGMFC